METSEQKQPRKIPIRLDNDEKIMRIVHRHPFGLFIIYLETLAAVAAVVGLMLFATPEALQGTPGATNYIIAGTIGLGLLTALLVLLIATYVYRESQLFITNKHVIQVYQAGLFSRKISHLSLANVEDVTSEKRGIFATMFNYGTLYVETAGEQKNFQFANCPNPDAFAEEVLETREAFIESINSAAVGHRRLDQQMPIR